MDVQLAQKKLNLLHTFTTAYGSSESRDNLMVMLSSQGIEAVGQAAPHPRYDEHIENTSEALAKLIPLLQGQDLLAYDGLIRRLLTEVDGAYAAKAALDMAILDWVGKFYNLPIYRLWGISPATMPITSMTIGLDSPEEMRERAQELHNYAELKVKLDGVRDRELISAIREVCQIPVRVDANEGWEDRTVALREIEWLAGMGVTLIEQPLPAAQYDDMVWLKQYSPLPLIADEAFCSNSDIPRLAEAYHGINIKLMKCGGLIVAKDAIVLARLYGLKTMLGCMIESSVGIAAAAQLAPLVDYVDLDGNLLINNDPYDGHPVNQGVIQLNGKPGLGVSPK